MLKTRDIFPLLGPTGKGRGECRPQDQLRLLEGVLLTSVAQALQAPDIPGQGGFAHAATHPHVRREQGAEARRAMLLPLPARVFLLGLVDQRVDVALDRPGAAGRVRGQPTARWDGESSGRLPRLPRAIAGRLEHDGTLTAAPRDERRPSFVARRPRARRPNAVCPPCLACPFCPAV